MSVSGVTAWLAPDADFGILVLTNQGGGAATAATDALVGRLVGWYQTRRPAARASGVR